MKATVQSPLVSCECFLLIVLFLGRVAEASWSTKLTTSEQKWRKATIYEIMPDRFNNPLQNIECQNPNAYCGGTFLGIKGKDAYIKGMNFRSVWLTPFVENTLNGYHGYWPLNLYSVNPAFGTEQDFQGLLQKLSTDGLLVMLDMVFNHMGYGSVYPSFNYYYNPFNQVPDFHDCEGCDPGCSVPGTLPNVMDETTYLKMWKCELSSLPDLNQNNGTVSQGFVDWLEYVKGKYIIDGFRYDAIPFIYPDFMSLISNTSEVFGLGEIFLDAGSNGTYQVIDRYLTAGKTLLVSEKVGEKQGTFSQLDYQYYWAVMECFTPTSDCCEDDAGIGCRQISYVRKRYEEMGLDQKLMGRFLESADVPRFLAQNNNTIVLQNALALLFFGEGIPISWQGIEQGMGATETMFGEREPVWLYGFSTASPLYVYFRMINYYRYTLELWDSDMVENFVDQNTFAFSMGSNLFTVLTNGNATQSSFTLANLPKGSFCSLGLYNGQKTVCVDVPSTGTLEVEADPLGYPLIFVSSKKHMRYEVFTPYQHWSTEWVFGVVATILSPMVGFLLYLCIHYLTPFSIRNWLTEWTEKTTSELMTFVKINRNIEENDDIFSKQLSTTFDKPTENQLIVTITEGKTISDTGSLSIVPPLFASHKGTGTPMGAYLKAYKDDPFLVWHMALEYSIPHLGFSNQLMFGGLGKVVEMFAEYAVRPLVICAPMYDVFYDKTGKVQTSVLGEHWQMATQLPLFVDDDLFEIDIYLVTPTLDNPKVFYFLLDCHELFGFRSRGKIYTFESEKQQLLFFSAYSQIIGFLIRSFRINSAQFHDNHAGLSLAYVNPADRPSVLLTLHNGDYNTTFTLGSSEREKYIYKSLSLYPDASNRLYCEHMGKFDFMNYVISHVEEHQNGMGIVAVSPRYAQRCYDKFARFWMIEKIKVIGILNGMSESDRVVQIPEDLDAFLEQKKVAKQSLQQRLGLQKNPHAKLIVFFGRVTHQKGCDLIGRAAPGILKSDPDAQLVVAGPIGDSYGTISKNLMADAALKFPGRVANLVGQYIAGIEKDELIMACDFFLCPSRFEPCGLADIEMGWMGAVMVGHGTGGLQKMPGFYFEGKLDNKEDLAMRLEETTKKALQATPDEIKAMAKDAMKKTFPPEEMVQAYESLWEELNYDRRKRACKKDPENIETMFFDKMWQSDNKILNDDTKESWDVVKAYWSNILLILCQSFFRLPALVGLIWVDYVTTVGVIQENLNDSSPFPAFLEWFLIYLLVTVITAPCWQWLCWRISPRRYIGVGCFANILSWLSVLWSSWAPSAILPLYLIAVILSNAPVSFIGLIFIDAGGKVSVSQDGIKLFGISDVAWFSMLAIVYGINVRNIVLTRLGIQIAAIVFLVGSVMVTLYFMSPTSLPPHFDHLRLRFRGQWSILSKKRKAWYAYSVTVFFDSFNRVLTLGALFEFITNQTYLVWSYTAMALSLVISVACMVILLTSRLGAKGSVGLMYAIVVIPYISLFQILIIAYGPDWSALIAATVLNAFEVRGSLTGVLNLQTMPSRETTLTVTTIQVMIGSIAIGISALVGWKLERKPWPWLTLCSITETLRLLAVATFVKLHQKESLAGP